MADLWSDYTDVLIDVIDAQLKNKYTGMTLRALLTTPSKFANKQNLPATVQQLHADVDEYIEDRFKTLEERVIDTDQKAAKCDAITKQLGQSIAMEAKQNKIPLITPAYIDRDTAKDEVIYVSELDAAVSALVPKLVASSVFISYRFDTYKEYLIGEWLFSGSKNYVLSAYLEPSEVINLTTAKAELDELLDAAAEYVATA